MATGGDAAAKAVMLFVGIAAFNAYRRGELGAWARAKFFNAAGPVGQGVTAAGGSPLGLTTADVFLSGLRTRTDAPAGDLPGGAVGGAVGGAIGTGATTGSGIVAVPGITGGLSASFAARWVPMAAAARVAGVVLTGGGYRSNARQVQLRIQHGCGGANIYNASCKGTPPTAVPGKSRHESGEAVDVNLTGAGGRNSPEFRWLAANAAKYGIYNLPSEPWHWSKDGK